MRSIKNYDFISISTGFAIGILLAVTMAFIGCYPITNDKPNKISYSETEVLKLKIGDLFYLNDPQFEMLTRLVRFRVIDGNEYGVYVKNNDHEYEDVYYIKYSEIEGKQEFKIIKRK